jgi:hypothetical protein
MGKMALGWILRDPLHSGAEGPRARTESAAPAKPRAPPARDCVRESGGVL